MERGNTSPERVNAERTPVQTERNLGRAAVQHTETVRSADRTRNLGQKALTATPEPIPPKLNINYFITPELSHLYSVGEVKSDRDYAERRRIELEGEHREKVTHAQRQAKNLEVMFLYGIQRNAWLGNTLNVFGKPPFTTETSASTDYDDIRHRIDGFTTLTFPKARPDEKHQACVTRAVLGFDATISGDRTIIMKKLTCCQNDRSAKLPFGFSQIKYYAHKNIASKQMLVPRYTIGISDERVENLKELAHIERRGKTIVNMRFNPGQSAMTRFMILSEIRAQNEFYRAMLPDQLDTNMLKQADMQLSLISTQLNAALDQCVDRLSQHKWLMGDRKLTPVEDRTPEEREALRQEVEAKIMERCRREQREHGEELERRKNGGFLPPDYRPKGGYEDAFVQIMECTYALTDAAKAGRLNMHRGVFAHTKDFKLPRPKHK